MRAIGMLNAARSTNSSGCPLYTPPTVSVLHANAVSGPVGGEIRGEAHDPAFTTEYVHRLHGLLIFRQTPSRR